MAVAALVAVSLAGQPCSASESVERVALDEFTRITVLYGGRKMPLDSFARAKLLEFSGKQTVDKEPAIHWLARVLFAPEGTLDDAVFLVNNPEIADTLGIPRDKHRRYTYRQLEAGYEIPKNVEFGRRVMGVAGEDRTPFENEFVRVYRNIMGFSRMSTAFTFDKPHADFEIGAELAEHLALSGGPTTLSCLDVLEHLEALRESFVAGHARKPEEMSPLDREVMRVVAALYARKQTLDSMSDSVAMIPVPGSGNGDWRSPWKVVVNLDGNEAIFHELQALSRIKQGYLDGDRLRLERAVRDFRDSIESRVGPEAHSRRSGLELMYSRMRPFFVAKFWYAFGFLFGLMAFLWMPRSMMVASLVFIGTGFLFHTAGILMRMLIMGRPPITNLYATFLFVGWVIVLLGLLLVRFGRGPVGAALAGFSGLFLLMLSGKFASDGDTMGVLVAVLDSNFWLATHVITINMGYAGCVAAGVVGHIYLILAILKSKDRAMLMSTYRSMLAVLGFGLIFSALGTMLGGIWADQSWGRFWGWDPKENGALLIVIWCALLYHANLDGTLRQIGMAAGTVVGIAIVALAWFGVNLLSVGLHSYGFTSGAGTWMLVFFVVEFVFLAVTVPLARLRTA